MIPILFLLPGNFLFSQVSLKEIALKNGLYAVGFQNYLTSDSTRTYKRASDWNNRYIIRPISVSVWYTSDKNFISVDNMTVLNYMEILEDEEEWEHLPNEEILNWFYYPNTPDNRKHLTERTTSALKSYCL